MDKASLYREVEPSAISPPTVTREQTLPFGSLSWENFEQLCLRLAEEGGDVEDARIYGERGQAQEGIDLLVRRAAGDYVTWQCKRYQEITETNLKNAVTKFLDGDWAKRTKVFRLAVAPSLNATELVEEIERQRVRLNPVGVTFEALDCHGLSGLLKNHPKLVDDFFGRPWVEVFNGPDAAAALSRRKLTREQKAKARQFLRTIYATQFQVVDGGIPAAAPVFQGAIKRLAVFDRYVEPTVQLVDSIVTLESPPASASGAAGIAGGQQSFRRREVRSQLALSAALSTSDRFVLLGKAGFGKSAALRVMVHALLGDAARFPALTKTLGQRLPLLIPFAFLTRHFVQSEAPTIESALKAWLKILGAKDDGLTLLEEMLEDERLLLLVDGLDEWQNREAAVAALTALTTYIQTRGLPMIATGRPLGFERINDFGPEWKRVEIQPLTADQQREFATHWFRHFHEAQGATDTTTLAQVVARGAGDFASDLADDPVRSELAGVPLLLSVLVYLRLSGRVLPHSRLEALEELVKALLVDQPSRRAQSAMQPTDQAAVRSPRIRRGLEYLAYCIHQEPNSHVLSDERAADLLLAYFRTVFELNASEAEEWSGRVLELGRNEFGVLVAPQEKYVGLMHRIFQEYLAAKYLARLPFDRVKGYCAGIGQKGPWHEVTVTLLQLLERPTDVDQLIEELRKPAAEALDEPGRQILLARLSAAETNCSRSKACDLARQAFSWIECGRWMPLRLALVRELAAGLESEQIGALVASRAERWFPGRVRWLHDLPAAMAKQAAANTVSDLSIALHNAEGSYDRRCIAEALAACAPTAPHLADEFVDLLSVPAEPDLMAAALHALAAGWPTHQALPGLLSAASAAPAKELRQVAFLIRFNRGERTSEVRDALVGFCHEGQWPYPWEKEITDAVVSGWPREPGLKQSALQRVAGIGYPGSWAPKPAITFLLRAYPGDDDVARLLAEQLNGSDRRYSGFNIIDVHKDLLAGFIRHPLIVPAAEAWLENPENTKHSPLEVAVLAQLAGTPKCRQALLNWLRRGDGMPAWIISTFLEMYGADDPEFLAAFAEYIQDDRRRADAVRWLDLVVRDQQELASMLRAVLRDGDVNDSHHALTILVEKEGPDAAGVWPIVEQKLTNDSHGHYWRLGHRILVKIWPQQPLIRRLARETVYAEDMSLSYLFEAYASDANIRPLLEATLQVLHEDLRFELMRAIEPLARRGLPAAVAMVGGYRCEPNGEARTVAARSYARVCRRSGKGVAELATALARDLTGFLMGQEERSQAAVAGLLELGCPDLVAAQREDGRPFRLGTHSGGSHNWELVATLVERWEELAAAAPDIWERFDHSPILVAELAKAGKGSQALSQTVVLEDAIRAGKQVAVEQVRALIALHGRSTLLRDLFAARLQHFVPGQEQSMMVIERAGYHAMGTYLADHFHGDAAILPALREVARSPMIHEVGLIALCRGWPDCPEIATATMQLPTLLDGPEPITAWMFTTKADSALMARYVMGYPKKIHGGHFDDPREGLAAVRSRLQSDRECRDMVFTLLQQATDRNTQLAVARLLAPTMRSDAAFRDWLSAQIRAARDGGQPLAPFAFDVLANACKPVEFILLETALTR